MILLKKNFRLKLSIAIFFFISFSESFSRENIFIIENVKVEGPITTNFSREKYIDKAFLNSFDALMSEIVLSRDLKKLKNIKLREIKNLISSFQIQKETYRNDKYEAIFKIFYNDIQVKKLLGKKNISFSQPKTISAIFYPTLFINEEMKDFKENYFYQKWNTVEIKNETINFILPLEDLDDISKITKMKNRIEEIEIDDFVNKYDIKNYVFAFMNFGNKKLKVHLKTNFNNNKISKNIFYDIKNIESESELNLILKDLKKQITEIWKEDNIINLAMPLSLRVKFQYKNPIDLDNLENTFYKISIVDNASLEEFNINNSFFKIYYYGNPKKLQSELLKFNYKLKNDQGYWEVHLDD